MRILHVIRDLDIASGGPGVVAPNMAASVARRGHEVQIFTTVSADRTGPPVPSEHGGALIRSFRRSWPADFGASYTLAKALLSEVRSFDVLHIHSLYLFHSTVASAVARHHQIPYVVRPHGTLHPAQRSVRQIRKAVFHRLIEDRNLAGAGAVHYTSAIEQGYAETAGVTAPGWVIPLAVAAHGRSATTSNAFFERFPLLQDRLLIVFLGRLASKKRPDLVVEAFARVKASVPTAHLVIAGPDDGLLTRLRAQVQAYGLDHAVTFPGLVRDSVKSDLLAAAKAFVLPSNWENFGVSVAEAMAASVPVVITAGVDISTEVEEAAAGFVVTQDPDAIADRLVAILTNDELQRGMGQRGRALAEEKFNWDAVALQLEAMYEAVAARDLADRNRYASG
jgi:glycosyltransferase involved in cell wall biosynthesis